MASWKKSRLEICNWDAGESIPINQFEYADASCNVPSIYHRLCVTDGNLW
jgi:hypothetical protein